MTIKSLINTILVLVMLIQTSHANTRKKLEFIDKTYEENIRTVILFRGEDVRATTQYPPVVPLNHQAPLILKFDEINTENADYYRVKILHCDFDWKKSRLTDQQYLYEFNEFQVEYFEFSVTTKIPFTHFTFEVPRVRIAGNYLLVVYRESDENDIIITRRFVVYDQKVRIASETLLTPGLFQRRINQQVSFYVDYKGFFVSNPYLDIKVMVRQNHRWDNAVFNLPPTSVREDVNQILYRHFNFENYLLSGNEFRFFDLRTIHFGGRNVDRFDIGRNQVNAFLYFDKSRGTEAYSLINDLNGGYIIQNSEGMNNFLEADYIKTHFVLDLKGKFDHDIFIAGKLTDWEFSESTKMNYVESSGLYVGSLVLKQGLYDFIYYVPSDIGNPYILEGSHPDTRNEYEIFVYYSDPMLGIDVPVGYLLIM